MVVVVVVVCVGVNVVVVVVVIIIVVVVVVAPVDDPTIIERARGRALHQLREGQPPGPGPPPVGFEANLFRRSGKGAGKTEGSGKEGEGPTDQPIQMQGTFGTSTTTTPGHFRDFLVIGMPYATMGPCSRADLCSLIADVVPKVDG